MALDSSDLNFPGLPDELLAYAESLGHGELHIKMDKTTGLRAIVSIHNTRLGPALGGCRFIEYKNASEATYDAMRLARGMTYKAAISNLPLGGGKSVIIRPRIIENREALFESFGEFVESLGGRYITAVDSGTAVEDMDVIHRKTNYVTSTTRPGENKGDPSYSTAYGVYRGLLAAVKFRLGKNDLDGLTIAIQGTGHVGYPLAKYLHDDGANLIVSDMNNESAKRCAEDFNARMVDPSEIFSVDCDVFSPCALGAILNDDTIAALKAKVIAGSANNQLAQVKHGHMLMQKNILYAPDYVVNAGGLIEVALIYQNKTPEEIKQQVGEIYNTTMTIFERSVEERVDPATIADGMASEKIYGKTA